MLKSDSCLQITSSIKWFAVQKLCCLHASHGTGSEEHLSFQIKSSSWYQVKDSLSVQIKPITLLVCHCVLENVAINYIFADHRSAGSPMQRLTILLLNDYLWFLEIYFMADVRECMRTYFLTKQIESSNTSLFCSQAYPNDQKNSRFALTTSF